MTEEKMLYGVDLEKSITPTIVRDALVECFYDAHCADAELGTDNPVLKKAYILEILKKTFADVGGNFDEPTKETMLKVMNNLSKFAKNFRDKTIIEKHARQIIQILEKL